MLAARFATYGTDLRRWRRIRLSRRIPGVGLDEDPQLREVCDDQAVVVAAVLEPMQLDHMVAVGQHLPIGHRLERSAAVSTRASLSGLSVRGAAKIFL